MQTVKKLFVAVSIASLLGLSGCARDLDSSTYVDSSTVGLVLEGVVISARPVKVKGADKLGNNKTGMLAGGAAGAVGGSMVGQGGGQVAAAVGAGLVGAALGALAESELSTSDGIEYIVKVSKENLGANDRSNSSVNFGNNSVDNKLKNSVQTSMKTEMISVVQGKDVILPVGQKVYVIYSDDRPRLVAAQ
jgi:outer membrane lipoprotein SlyB